MAKNNSLQIAIFIDKYVKFKISNSSYSIDYKEEELTFSEFKSVVESNLKYWDEKSLKSEMCEEIQSSWNGLNDRIKVLMEFLEKEYVFTIDRLYILMYYIFPYNYNTVTNDTRVYEFSLSSPIDKDNGISMIRIFIDYYLNSWAKDGLSTAIKNYVYIEKNKSYIGQYLNNTNAYSFLPAFFVFNKEIRKEEMPFNNFQEEVVKPVSEKVEKIDSQINDKFKETTNLIEEKDKDIINLFDEHKNEIDEFKTKINEWRDNKEKEIEALEETYKSKLQLEAPETLWESRAEEYRKKSERWIWYLLAFIVGLLASGGYFAVEIHDYVQEMAKGIPFISKSFIYVALISFLIYIIRIIIKIIISSQHTSMEYEQKAALTRFYQALIQDGKEVDKEEKLIIFNALFRKTDTGLIKSDNSNDTDALLSQFSKLVK